MEITLEGLSFVLSLLSVIFIPAVSLVYRKLSKLDAKFNEIIQKVEHLKILSDNNDEELQTNWLHFYNNEIIRFNERLKMKPEHVPSPEHYKSVFTNYTRYKELGGNGYVDVIMDNIKELYKIHYKFDSEDYKK